MLQIMNQILTQGGFLRAFFQTVILIAAGCALFRANILGLADKHALTTVVWKLAVPCMAFDAFMSDFNMQEFLSELGVLALSFALYAVLYALGTLLFRRTAGRDAKVCGLFCAVGQLTLFAMPVLQSIYAGTGSTVLISVSVMTIPFRVMVYIVSFFTISALKPDRKNLRTSIKSICLNPIILAMTAGILIWVLQNHLPQVACTDGSYAFLRLDKTIPSLYAVVQTMEKLVFPLSMLLIGMSLGACDLKTVLSDRRAWAASVIRMVFAPALALGAVCAVQASGLARFTASEMVAVTMGFAAPASATLGLFCIQYRRCEQFASTVCFLSTVLCLVTIPLVYALTQLAAASGLF